MILLTLVALIFLDLHLEVMPRIVFENCLEIQENMPSAKSGLYNISRKCSPKTASVFCDMDINNGGYTFYPLSSFNDGTLEEHIASMTNKKSVLLYMKTSDDSIKYGVLKQLHQYKKKNVLLEMIYSKGTAFQSIKCAKAINGPILGAPFLCLQFLDYATASDVNNVQGLSVNGNEITFKNCDANPNSYLAFFNKFSPASDYSYAASFPFLDSILNSLEFHPLQNDLPNNYFSFLEMHFGGCGVYTSTDGRPNIRNFVAAAIGFK